MELKIRPFGKVVDAAEGTSLLAAITSAKINLRSDCGGAGRCGKCRVVSAEGGLSAVCSPEKQILSSRDLRKGVRLACQALITGPTEIQVPPSSVESRIRILVEGTHRSLKADPSFIKTGFPDISRQAYKDLSWETLLAEMERQGETLTPTLHVLRQIAEHRVMPGESLSLMSLDGIALGLKKDISEPSFGLAVDVGTTTVVGYLADLSSAEILSHAACPNPQIKFGADVVSRIQYGIFEPRGLAKLQEAIVRAINDMVRETSHKARVAREQIYTVCPVGNTTMHHLLLGLRPTALSRYPYRPVVRQALMVPAKEIGIAIHPEGRVYLPPLISGFMGSDTVGVVLSTKLHQSHAIKLAIDFGTNGEVVLGNRDRLVGTSCAAGPAFEGSHIAYGMTGSSGAIDKVSFDADGQIHIHTVDDYPAVGICGSGLVDAVSHMHSRGVVDRSGRLLTREELKASPLSSRLKRVRGQSAFLLFEDDNRGTAQKIYVIQKDIRELQLAKGALRAAIQILMMELGIVFGDITEVLLAGAFGNYVDPNSAIGIGLLPRVAAPKIKAVGNAAGVGAQMVLLSKRERLQAQEIAANVDYVDLAVHPAFQDQFIQGMAFPGPI